MPKVFLVRLPSGYSQWTVLTVSQHWFRYWFGAIRQQAIAWTNQCWQRAMSPYGIIMPQLTAWYHDKKRQEWKFAYFIHYNVLFVSWNISSRITYRDNDTLKRADMFSNINFVKYFGVLHCLVALHSLPDVRDESRYVSLVSEITEDLGDGGLNVLFNNAAIGALKPLGLEDVDSDDLMENYRVNAVAPVMLTKVIHMHSVHNMHSVHKFATMIVLSPKTTA